MCGIVKIQKSVIVIIEMKTKALILAWSLLAGILWWFLLFGKNEADNFEGMFYNLNIIVKLLAYIIITAGVFVLGKTYHQKVLRRKN